MWEENVPRTVKPSIASVTVTRSRKMNSVTKLVTFLQIANV